MPLYRIVDQKFHPQKQQPVQKEKDLQHLVEPNLLTLLDVHFIQSEYSTTSGGRIDTLGVDLNGAPVIIEYKRKQNDNIINQALSYRKWLTAQKREFFEMLIRKHLPSELAESIQLDWKHPRIICIAETFNRFDVDTADVLLPVFRVELMRYRAYEGGIFSLEPLQIVNESKMEAPSVSNIEASEEAATDKYSVEAHLAKAFYEIQELFEELRSLIKALGPQVVERPRQIYIGYRAAKNFAEVHIQKSAIRIDLRPIKYEDPQKRVTKVPETHNWTLDRQTLISSPGDLDYVMNLVEQSYNDVA
jgi:predicted transport protein